MATKLRLGPLDCVASILEGSSRVVYILFPLDALDGWIDEAAANHGFSIISLCGMDWDNDLTPWPAAGVPTGNPPFAGDAAKFLQTLRSVVIPKVEQALGIEPARRDLLGVSLSGLFALWQWMECDEFRSIAVMSGSFWYEGFVGWLGSRLPVAKEGSAFFLLGDKECHAPVPQFQSVERDTREVVALLQRSGIHVEFTMVPGNHYQHMFERLELSLTHLEHFT